MAISEQELRAMVRDAVSRHTHTPTRSEQSSVLVVEAGRPHASHGLLALGPTGDPDGRCVIEPAVACTHCGYCQSMGH